MIHAHTRQECEVIAEKLAKENNLQQYTMLYSVKEWKKQVCDTLMKLKMNNFLEGDLMVSEKMYELGTKKSTIRTIFEYGRKRALEVGEEKYL